MKFKILIPLLLSILILPIFAQRTTTTDVLQTIPPISISSPNAIAGCTILSLDPGSIVAGTSGFVKASCPNFIPAIILSSTETPTFLLTTGWSQIALMWYGSVCSFRFLNHFPNGTLIPGARLLGMNLTSASPITFTTLSNSTTQLMMGGYNYCLFFSNAPVNGIASFTVAWSP